MNSLAKMAIYSMSRKENDESLEISILAPEAPEILHPGIVVTSQQMMKFFGLVLEVLTASLPVFVGLV